MRTALNFVLELLFPTLCQSCGAEGTYLCRVCAASVARAADACLECRKISLLGKIHQECRGKKWNLEGVLVAASYQELGIRNLVWHLKYSGVTKIGELLAVLMVDYVVEKDLADYFAGYAVVPVPLHKRRLRLRGFNQAEVLANNFAQRLGLPYLPVLQKTRGTPRQVDLTKQDRLKNLDGAVACRPDVNLADKKIILIDDVATTGATLNECAKVLKNAGAAEVWGFVVARN